MAADLKIDYDRLARNATHVHAGAIKLMVADETLTPDEAALRSHAVFKKTVGLLVAGFFEHAEHTVESR